jgi:hypothetical protein
MTKKTHETLADDREIRELVNQFPLCPDICELIMKNLPKPVLYREAIIKDFQMSHGDTYKHIMRRIRLRSGGQDVWYNIMPLRIAQGMGWSYCDTFDLNLSLTKLSQKRHRRKMINRVDNSRENKRRSKMIQRR